MRGVFILIAFSLVCPAPCRAESGFGFWIEEDYPRSDDGRTFAAGVDWASCGGRPWSAEYSLLTNQAIGSRADFATVKTRILNGESTELWLGGGVSGALGGKELQVRVHKALASGEGTAKALEYGVAPRIAPWVTLNRNPKEVLGLRYTLNWAPHILSSAQVGPAIRLGPFQLSGGYLWGTWLSPGMADVLGQGWWSEVSWKYKRLEASIEAYPTSRRGLPSNLFVWRVGVALGGKCAGNCP